MVEKQGAFSISEKGIFISKDRIIQKYVDYFILNAD